MTRPIALFLVTLMALSAHASDVVVTLQVRPDADIETLRQIAKLAAPRERTLDRDMWAYEILREEYGSSHAKIRLLFADYNKGMERFKQGDTVMLPPAPSWLFNVEERVNASTTVKKYVEARLGAAGPINLESIAEKTGIAKSAVEKLKPGAKIVLPYVAEPVTLDVREEDLPRIEQAIEELKRSDDAIEILEVTPELTLTPHAVLSTADGQCPIAPIPPQTHCNVENLDRYPKKARTVVAVIDSGVPNGDTRFNFWKNAGETGPGKKKYIDDDGNHYIDDTIGTDLIVGGGYPRDDVTRASHRYHGTHVAGLASCRVATNPHQALINDRVELMILKVASADGSVQPAAVMNAIAYAMKYNAHIVNLSLEGATYEGAVHQFMTLGTKMLFVAAAGNGVASVGQDLGAFEVYPAKLSKELPNVMSVAAHDGSGALACFSNYNGDIVDIAAPGQSVQSTIAGGEGVLSGTSQAAPLVTLGAALLHASGLDDPVKIRERLVVSADFKPALRGKVRSEGTLNIARALAYGSDLVVSKSSGTLEGELIAFTGVGAIPAASIRKVINGYDTAPGKLVKIVTATGPRFANALPDVTIRTAAGDVTVAGTDVLEIIPRLR
jgi:hypothetical protein